MNQISTNTVVLPVIYIAFVLISVFLLTRTKKGSRIVEELDFLVYGIYICLLSPAVVYLLVLSLKFYFAPIVIGVGNSGDWISFFGAVFGGFMTFFAVIITLIIERIQRNKEDSQRYMPYVEISPVTVEYMAQGVSFNISEGRRYTDHEAIYEGIVFQNLGGFAITSLEITKASVSFSHGRLSEIVLPVNSLNNQIDIMSPRTLKILKLDFSQLIEDHIIANKVRQSSIPCSVHANIRYKDTIRMNNYESVYNLDLDIVFYESGTIRGFGYISHNKIQSLIKNQSST